MSVDRITLARQDIASYLSAKYAGVFFSAKSLQGKLNDRLLGWAVETRLVLDSTFPYADHHDSLLQWQENFSEGGNVYDADAMRQDYKAFCEDAGYPVNESFWHGELGGASSSRSDDNLAVADQEISIQLLLLEWQKQINQTFVRWEMQLIEERKRLLLEELVELLDAVEGLQGSMNLLGLDAGLWLDFSEGNLSAQDMARVRQWASYLANDEGVRSLCDMLGKIRQMEFAERLESIRSHQDMLVTVPDFNSREEIIGIRLGKDLEHALPSELALLSDPDISLLFDLKYVESRIMCFDMQGMQAVQESLEIEIMQSVQEPEKHGPMIICIDTSGSMSGSPETIAKAVTLYMATKSLEHQRACYLINFSTGISTLNLTPEGGMQELLHFLAMSFHGGTDAMPALNQALQMMEEHDYAKADLLVISDFVMGRLPVVLHERIQSRRSQGNSFHSLVVGDSYMSDSMRTLFDNEWVYDPQSGTVHELLSVQKCIHA